MEHDDDDGLDSDESKTCQRCRFFREIMIDQDGECRKYAPQPLRMRPPPRRGQIDNNSAEWPTVGVGDWCGDFEEHPHKCRRSWD